MKTIFGKLKKNVHTLFNSKHKRDFNIELLYFIIMLLLNYYNHYNFNKECNRLLYAKQF